MKDEKEWSTEWKNEWRNEVTKGRNDGRVK